MLAIMNKSKCHDHRTRLSENKSRLRIHPSADLSTVYLAMYKGPADNYLHKITHIVTCCVLSLRELKLCKYSHAELVIDSVCYSSSPRDSGVRSKVIDIYSGKWDLFSIEINKESAIEVFNYNKGKSYDWLGAVKWGLPLLNQNKNKYYCFEIIAEMLGLDTPSKCLPSDLISKSNKSNIKED
jgi:hypothetical protein